MLVVLAKKVGGCREELKTQETAMALYGLRNMSSDHEEVRSMLGVLARKVAGCRDVLGPQAVAMALHGLRKMSSDHQEVRSMLGVLTKKVADCKEELSPQGVGNALNGLRNMSSDHEEVRSMLGVLVEKVASCRDPLNPLEISNALYGLKGMDLGKDWRPFFSRLCSDGHRAAGSGTPRLRDSRLLTRTLFFLTELDWPLRASLEKMGAMDNLVGLRRAMLLAVNKEVGIIR